MAGLASHSGCKYSHSRSHMDNSDSHPDNTCPTRHTFDKIINTEWHQYSSTKLKTLNCDCIMRKDVRFENEMLLGQFKVQVNSQESTGNRTRHLLGACSRQCHRDRHNSCHNGQLNSFAGLGHGCFQTPEGETQLEKEYSVLLQPLSSPWACSPTAGFLSHTSGQPGYNETLKDSSGPSQRNTQPGDTRIHTHTQ